MLRPFVLRCCVLALACGGTSPAAPAPATPPPSEAAQEEEAAVPVAPDLNKRYREETDASVWEKRFERDGREAHDNKGQILDALHLERGMAVADVGAGSGLFTQDFSRAVGDDGTVFVVDVQDYFLEHVRAELETAGIKNAKFVKADQRSSNLPESSIDLAFMCDVYHHVEYPQSYLASLRRALKPNGRLIVIDFIAIEGQSRDWILEHVRAPPEAFRAEIEAAGFTFTKSHDILKENFFYEFSRSARSNAD